MKVIVLPAILILALAVVGVSHSAAQVVIRSEEDPPNAYAIGVGDVIEISVWKSPELSVSVPVRPDGRVSVPLLGDIQAAGMTPLALKEDLTRSFRKFVTA